MNSEDPQLAHLPLGCVTFVSTGSSSGSARWISPHCLQYHTGTGVANTLCLLSTQSQARLCVQSMSLYLMKSGYQMIFFACSMTWLIAWATVILSFPCFPNLGQYFVTGASYSIIPLSASMCRAVLVTPFPVDQLQK